MPFDFLTITVLIKNNLESCVKPYFERNSVISEYEAYLAKILSV